MLTHIDELPQGLLIAHSDAAVPFSVTVPLPCVLPNALPFSHNLAPSATGLGDAEIIDGGPTMVSVGELIENPKAEIRNAPLSWGSLAGIVSTICVSLQLLIVGLKP